MTLNNKINEFLNIKTGDTVYISGLPGKNYSFINNKYGILKNVFISSINNQLSHIGQVDISNESYFVNFDYIFNIENLNNFDIKEFVKEEKPFNYFINIKNIQITTPIFDENWQIMGLSEDFEKRKYVFLYSGIN